MAGLVSVLCGDKFGRDEEDAVERKLLEGGAGQNEMSVMDRVEAAAEDAGLHGWSVAGASWIR